MNAVRIRSKNENPAFNLFVFAFVFGELAGLTIEEILESIGFAVDHGEEEISKHLTSARPPLSV